MAISAILFDFGGVINNMRWDVARELEDEHGLERNALLKSLYGNEEWRDVEEGRGDDHTKPARSASASRKT